MDRIHEWLADMARIADSLGAQIGSSKFSIASLIALLVVLAASWFAARYFERAVRRMLLARQSVGAPAGYAIGRLLRYSVWILGSLVALQVIGFDLSSLALIGGALGLGIGFGLQNLVANFVSGIVLLVERTIKVGDFVDLASGVRGTVTEIGVRYTRVTTNSAVDVIVPNLEFTSQRVTNWTLDNRYRRLNIPFSVAYGSDKDAVRAAGLAAAQAVPSTVVDDTRRTDVWFVKFGESALEFSLVVWVGRDAVNRPGSTQSRYLWALDDALRTSGIEVPFPQRDLHVRSGQIAVTMEHEAGPGSPALRT